MGSNDDSLVEVSRDVVSKIVDSMAMDSIAATMIAVNSEILDAG